MRNLLLTVAYNGGKYHGFQVQKNALTVAEVIQNAIEGVFKSRLDIKGCSRTDTGVHANGYCMNFYTDNVIPCEKVITALNLLLPRDISVYDCKEVESDFHARYCCKEKEYIYKVDNSAIRSPFSDGLAYHYPYPLDEEKLNAGSKVLIGTHDFSAFCNRNRDVVEDKVRTIYNLSVWREGSMIYFSIRGDGFLYNMVRIIVGTLITFNMKENLSDELEKILLSKDRQNAGKTAPAHGLYLNQVNYD